METSPVEFVKDGEGNLSKVKLQNGQELEADVCVLGIGVVPNTDYLEGSGIDRDSRGFVQVDATLKSRSKSNVYAAGDIAKFPLRLRYLDDDVEVAIGHWQLALSHGKTAGLNVGNDDEAKEVNSVPFFWSMQFGKSLRYAGHAPRGFDDVVIDGSVQEGKFAAFYMKNDTAMAVATVMMDPVAADFANLLLEGKTLARADLSTSGWRNKYSLEAKA